MPEAKHREPIIPMKVKVLVEELLHQKVYSLQEAAEKAELSTYLARRYLKRPNVLRYFREERAAMLEEICAGNAQALALVRAEFDNGMAVAAAVRQLEAMRQSIVEETGGAQGQRAGLQIVIIQQSGEQRVVSGPGGPAPAAPAPTIDINPEQDPLLR